MCDSKYCTNRKLRKPVYTQEMIDDFKNARGINDHLRLANIKEAYLHYWDKVKDSVDADGWVYVRELPHMLDFYFEQNTGCDIEYEKSYKDGHIRGPRWRPTSIGQNNK